MYQRKDDECWWEPEPDVSFPLHPFLLVFLLSFISPIALPPSSFTNATLSETTHKYKHAKILTALDFQCDSSSA